MISTLINFSLAALCFINTSLDLEVSKAIEKRMRKEITKVFLCKDYEMADVTDSPSFKFKNSTYLSDHRIYKISRLGSLLGYAFLGTAPSKTDTFEYLILFDQNFIQMKAKVMVYREDYGGEISSNRWLSQFKNTSLGQRFIYGDNISAISGATISVKSMTNSINYVYSQLQRQLAIASR
ncbi:MAG: FMN-binding protein [Flavobacteriaceae bacterium]|jgi:Na+-translocating ferredoxin:NAD+ oxidoreductase RnfG subunit